MDFPRIDPKVKHVRSSKARKLKDEEITALNEPEGETLVLQVDDQPVAVMLGYNSFLELQQLAEKGKASQGGH